MTFLTRAVAVVAVALASGLPAVAQTTGFAVKATVPKTWTDHTFTGSDGTKFHYIEQGTGTPVILIHGFRWSAVGNWFNTGIAQRIARTNRVIAMDMRGHGETGPSPADSKGTMAGDVVELLDFLKIPKAHIAGYSMGGATTVALLKMAPGRFITAAPMGIGVRETAEWLGKTPTDPQPPAAVGNPAAAARPPTAVRPDGIPEGAPPGAPVANQDVDLTGIKFPVLSINGSLDSPLVKTHRMWRELEDYTYVVIPGRTHAEAPGDPRLAEKLTAFIVAHNP